MQLRKGVLTTVGSQPVVGAHRHLNVSVPAVSWASGLSLGPTVVQGCMQDLSQAGLELLEVPWSPAIHLQEAWSLLCLPLSKHHGCRGLFLSGFRQFHLGNASLQSQGTAHLKESQAASPPQTLTAGGLALRSILAPAASRQSTSHLLQRQSQMGLLKITPQPSPSRVPLLRDARRG